MNILWLVLILMALVLVHEAGHMVVAKWCGMRVERFSIFFGRPIASFQRGETEYAIGWLPLGGYVKISGMTVGEDIPSEVAHRAYSAQPAWKKIATILAGPAVNILLAVIVFAAIFWSGIAVPTTSVGTVNPNSPALRAGLQPGDQILAVNGVQADGDFATVRDTLRAGTAGDAVRLSILRDGATIERTAQLQQLKTTDGTPAVDAETGRPLVGIGFTPALATDYYGPVQGLVEGADFTWFITKTNVEVIGEAFTSSQAREQINSVVGVTAVFNEVADDGFETILRFIGVISLALGIFNLLPILPLDGGHIVFAIAEKMKGSAFSAVTYGRASFVGLAIVMLVFVIALQNDIGRITGDGFQIDR